MEIIMRTPVIAVWAAVLLTYGVSTGIAMLSVKAVAEAMARAVAMVRPSAGVHNILKLDMAPKSVDNMYQDCKDKMYNELPRFLEKEKENTKFKAAWESSEQWYKENQETLSQIDMKRQCFEAIRCYTTKENEVYLDFNDAVRTQKDQYTTTFGYHALHFLLTDAIQTLRERRLSNLAPGEDECVTGYRRSDKIFDQVNTPLRFGSFTSTSMGQYADKSFGDKTCFEIYTCFGADIAMYSAHPKEREVLIPPYEVFEVVEVKEGPKYKDLPCEVEYKLRSTKKFVSNLNCALIKK